MSSEPKLGPDNQTVIWFVGTFEKIPYRDPEVISYFPEKVVCFRSGQKLSEFKLSPRFTVDCHFRKGSTQIAVAGEGTHGPVWYFLHDVKTGKQIDRSVSYAKEKPAWVQGLRDLY